MMKITAPIPEHEIVAPKEAVIAWKHNAVTQQVLKICEQELINSQERLSMGETLGEHVEQKTARAVGYMDGLNFIMTIMDVVNFVEDKEDANERRQKGKKDT